MTKKTEQPAADEQQSKQEFNIQRIYLKHSSFESTAPESFQSEWKPEMKMDLHTSSVNLKDDAHEVTLTLTINVSSNENKAFDIVVKQSGIFNIKGFEKSQVHQLLGSFCPGTLYPYAREVVSDLVGKASFPQLNLAPVNFDALYMQHLQKQKTKQQSENN